MGAFDDIKEFPYSGSFTRTTLDETKPLDERTEVTETVLETVCDIQESGHSSSGVIKATYCVYLPFSAAMPVRKGDVFSSSVNGMEVNGRVVGVFPSQMGCKIYVEDFDE